MQYFIVFKAFKALKDNCSEKFLLQNIFAFHVYITNIYIYISLFAQVQKNKKNTADRQTNGQTIMSNFPLKQLLCKKNYFDDNSILCTRPYLIFNQTTFYFYT